MCIHQFTPKYFISLVIWSQKLTNMTFCPGNCISMVIWSQKCAKMIFVNRKIFQLLTILSAGPVVIWSQKCAYINLVVYISCHCLLAPKNWQIRNFVLQIVSGWLFGPKYVHIPLYSKIFYRIDYLVPKVDKHDIFSWKLYLNGLRLCWDGISRVNREKFSCLFFRIGSFYEGLDPEVPDWENRRPIHEAMGAARCSHLVYIYFIFLINLI